MANERVKKKIDEHTSYWDQIKTSFTPGLEPDQRTQQLSDIADSNIKREQEEKAQKEAIRKRRMQLQGSGNGSN